MLKLLTFLSQLQMLANQSGSTLFRVILIWGSGHLEQERPINHHTGLERAFMLKEVFQAPPSDAPSYADRCREISIAFPSPNAVYGAVVTSRNLFNGQKGRGVGGSRSHVEFRSGVIPKVFIRRSHHSAIKHWRCNYVL